MRQWVWQTFMGILLLAVVTLLSWQAGTLAQVESKKIRAERDRPLVVIDSGHGGKDPGKVGSGGQLEKDINLAIALSLQYYLEASGVEVVLTRVEDQGLYRAEDRHKKAADMKKRCQIIRDSSPDLVVSIHQNSYHDDSVSGGQVFYYKGSEEGKRLAEILQERFDYVLGERNKRTPRPNDSYYLLLHVREPAVIVECGFLSNPREAEALEDPVYQDQMAWTIHMGIMEYLHTSEKRAALGIPKAALRSARKGDYRVATPVTS